MYSSDSPTGLGQSGTIFKHKTRALEQALRAKLSATNEYRYHTIDFVYPDGPLSCRAPDQTDSQTLATEFHENYCWTPENDNAGDIDPMPGLIKLAYLIKVHGPFDGAICFSQGGFAMAIAAALLASPIPIVDGEAAIWYEALCQEGSATLLQPPFRFLTTFCAPDVAHPKFKPLWATRISTPMLQIIGQFDTLVSENSSNGLSSKFLNSQVITHRGAHFVPKEKVCVDIAAEFMTRSLQESKVGRMDVDGYFDSTTVPGLIEDERDDDSQYSGSSSPTTPYTPDLELAIHGEVLNKTVKQLMRRSGVNVIRVRQPWKKKSCSVF